MDEIEENDSKLSAPPDAPLPGDVSVELTKIGDAEVPSSLRELKSGDDSESNWSAGEIAKWTATSLIAGTSGLVFIDLSYTYGEQISPGLGYFFAVCPPVGNFVFNLFFLDNVGSIIQSIMQAPPADRRAKISAQGFYALLGAITAIPISTLSIYNGVSPWKIFLLVDTQLITTVQNQLGCQVFFETIFQKCSGNPDRVHLQAQIASIIAQRKILTEKIGRDDDISSLLYLDDDTKLKERIAGVSQRSDGCLMNYIFPGIGLIGVATAFLGFIPNMYNSFLTFKFSTGAAAIATAATFTPLYTLGFYFTPGNYKVMLRYFKEFFETTKLREGSVGNRQEKEKLEKNIKYLKYVLMASIPFGFLSFPPASLLHDVYIIPWLVARTGGSSEVVWRTLLTIFAIIGAGGYLSTGAINIFEALAKKFQTSYATKHGNAREYLDEVLLSDLVAFFEAHPQGFSTEEISQQVKNFLEKIEARVRCSIIASDPLKMHQGEEDSLSDLRKSMEALSPSRSASSLFHRSPAIVATADDDDECKSELSSGDVPAHQNGPQRSCCAIL